MHRTLFSIVWVYRPLIAYCISPNVILIIQSPLSNLWYFSWHIYLIPIKIGALSSLRAFILRKNRVGHVWAVRQREKSTQISGIRQIYSEKWWAKIKRREFVEVCAKIRDVDIKVPWILMLFVSFHILTGTFSDTPIPEVTTMKYEIYISGKHGSV